MAKANTSAEIRRQFRSWVLPPGIVFLVLVVGLLYRPLFCNPLVPKVCEVTKEVKATDLLLVFFTYALVIVGWFTMRSADQNTKNAERAYLVATPLFGVPKTIPALGSVDEWTMRYRPKRSMFKGPWRMAIINFGKTQAYTTRVEWGLCPRDEFTTHVPISKLLDARQYTKWRFQYLRGVVLVQDIFPPNQEAPLHYRHIEISDEEGTKKVGWVFFGRITYKDVFKDEHFTTFSYHLMEEHADSLGKSLSDDHS